MFLRSTNTKPAHLRMQNELHFSLNSSHNIEIISHIVKVKDTSRYSTLPIVLPLGTILDRLPINITEYKSIVSLLHECGSSEPLAQMFVRINYKGNLRKEIANALLNVNPVCLITNHCSNYPQILKKTVCDKT